MRLPVRTSMISSGVDLKVCGLLLVHTERTVWPWMRAWTPLAIVSTSGSSGMPSESIWLALVRLCLREGSSAVRSSARLYLSSYEEDYFSRCTGRLLLDVCCCWFCLFPGPC